MKNHKTAPWHRILPVFVLMAVFYLHIAFQVPYTGDDWDWGLDVGLQHLLTADINSRYAGNFLVVIMTRSKLMQTLMMGIAFLALPVLMTATVTDSRLTENPKRTLILFLMANCLLLSMDSFIWQQTYGWISGFANYGFSAVLLEVCILWAMPLFRPSLPENNNHPVLLAALFLMGIVIQLFLENLAIFMVLFGIVVCALSLIRDKKIRWQYLAFLAGTVIGLVIMFNNSMYAELAQTGSTHFRKVVANSTEGIPALIIGAVENFSRDIVSMIWENNVVICCSISGILVLMWLNKPDVKYPALRWLLILINLLSIPYFIVFSHLEYGKYYLLQFGLLDIFEVIVNLGFFAEVILQVVLLFRDRIWQMWKLLLIWVGAPVVILPLTVVLDEGSRFYITSNIFLILFVLFLLDALLQDLPAKAADAVLLLGISALISFSLYYYFIYQGIGNCTRERMQIMEQAKASGEKQIVMPAYPYPGRDYVWWGEPGAEYREYYFREFFGLEQDVEMTFCLE